MIHRKESLRKRLMAVTIGFALLLAACGEARRAAPSIEESPASEISRGHRPSAAPGRARRQGSPAPAPAPSDTQAPEPGGTHAPDPGPTPTPTPPDETEGGLPASLVGTQWYTLPTTQKVVALTFDAGANANAAPSILATLAAYDVPATFFLTGKWVEAYPEYAARIGAAYPVANHSYSHPDLTQFSDGLVEREITGANDRIRGATGRDTRPMFRFPFGASDSRTIGIANSLGYGCINWTVDTRGWQGTTGGQSVDLIVDRVLDALRPGEIVIMHVGSHPEDGSTLDADALPRIIEEIRARGYGFVTIDQYL